MRTKSLRAARSPFSSPISITIGRPVRSPSWINDWEARAVSSDSMLCILASRTNAFCSPLRTRYSCP
uniref:Uncharacterized protein n=1 Tax=Rhizophora mucronata TaxID=61149 RepID=A0A2P2NHY3_RHIMU